MMKMSERIKSVMKESYLANDTIYNHIGEGDIDRLIDEVTDAFQGVLDALVIDTVNDHNTQDTAKRVAKMFINEIFRGRYYPPPAITAFPNAKQYDQIYMSGPMTINSTCAHHFQAISGKAFVGIFPGKKVIGLSKFNRMVDWVASRPQIQEEMTEQIADMIEQETEANGVAVIIKAEHFCMTARGVKEHESDMLTSVVRGRFREDSVMRAEFFSLLSNMKGMNG
jgi:GTP cyclohydrolase I